MQTGYPIDTTPAKTALADIARMNESATWVITAAYSEEGERGPVSIGICDDNERSTGVHLRTLVETFAQWFKDTPNEAQWIAEDLRKISETLESYTVNAVKCGECGELYSSEVLDHCNGCGEYPKDSQTGQSTLTPPSNRA